MLIIIVATFPLLLGVSSRLAQQPDEGVPWLAWVIIILFLALAVWFIWDWSKSRGQQSNQPGGSTPAAAKAPEPPPAAAPAVAAPVVAAAPAPVKPDDLTVIEGIGPKIAGVLQAAGIATFSQLAQADPQRLQKILTDADLRLADPHSWPEQASLAGAGKWAELKVLQDGLKGGRRV